MPVDRHVRRGDVSGAQRALRGAAAPLLPEDARPGAGLQDQIQVRRPSDGDCVRPESRGCSSILHLFVLPKPNPSMTVVAMRLDPPIRKGQTFYDHVLFQFETDAHMSLELNLAQDEMDAKNREYGGSLRKEMAVRRRRTPTSLSLTVSFRRAWFSTCSPPASADCPGRDSSGRSTSPTSPETAPAFAAPTRTTRGSCFPSNAPSSTSTSRRCASHTTTSTPSSSRDKVRRTSGRTLRREGWRCRHQRGHGVGEDVRPVHPDAPGDGAPVPGDPAQRVAGPVQVHLVQEPDGRERRVGPPGAGPARVVPAAGRHGPRHASPLEGRLRRVGSGFQHEDSRRGGRAGLLGVRRQLFGSRDRRRGRAVRPGADGGGSRGRRRPSGGPAPVAVSEEAREGAERGRWRRQEEAQEEGQERAEEEPLGLHVLQPGRERVRQTGASRRGRRAVPEGRETVRRSGVAFGEIGKIIGERWKALGEEEKKEYQEMAQKDKVVAASSRQPPTASVRVGPLPGGEGEVRGVRSRRCGSDATVARRMTLLCDERSC